MSIVLKMDCIAYLLRGWIRQDYGRGNAVARMVEAKAGVMRNVHLGIVVQS